MAEQAKQTVDTSGDKERAKRRRSRQRLGVMVLVLTVIGIFAVIFGGVKGVQYLLDNNKEKAEYEEILAPLVMLDPLPFNSIETANQSTLMQAAVWACVYNQDLSAIERDEMGALMLPAIDVERAAVKLYGPDFPFVKETFSDSGMEFLYQEDKDVFIVPITSQAGNYTPKVVKIKGWRQKTVTVGYLSPFNMEAGSLSPSDVPVKYVDYIFEKGRDGYYLIAIQESDMKPEVSSVSESSEASVPVAVEEDPESVLAEQQQQQDQAGGEEGNAA